MMLGMITSIVLIFGVFGFGGEEIVNKKYDLEQDRREQERKDAKRAKSLEQLSVELAELSSAGAGNLSDTLQICKARVDVSNEILERGPANEAMRQLAVSEGLMARVKLYGIDFVNDLKLEDVGPQLKAAYSPYLEDENKKIYSTARVSMLTHQSFEQLRSDNDDVDRLVSLFQDTMNRFPEDEYVSKMIEAHLFVLVEKETEYTEILFSKLRQRNPVGTLKPQMERRMRNIADRLLLKSENLEDKFADRWANGAAGRVELAETAVRLLEQDNVGLVLIQRVVAVGEWFERNDFLPQAKTIYDAMITSKDSGHVLAEFRDDAKQYAEDGLARLELQGKMFVYGGLDSAGKRLVDVDKKKHVGIVVFWSVGSKSSLKYLTELNRSSLRTLNNKPITIYAVCVDDELPSDINVMMRKSPMIRIIDPLDPNSPSGKNAFLDQCPPGLLPHVMIIDFDGKVHDINASEPAKVMNEVLALLMKKRIR